MDSSDRSGRSSWRRDVVALALAAAVSAAALWAVSPVLVGLTTADCGEGLDGLGCAIVGVYAGLVGALAVAGVLGGVVLRWRRVHRPVLVGVFGACGVAASWFLIRALTDGVPGTVIALFVAFLVWNVVFYALFVLTKLPVVAAAAAAIALVVVGYVALSPVGNAVDQRRSEQREQEAVEQAGFPVYATDRPPAGFRFHGGSLYDGDGYTMKTHYEASYLHGTNDGSGPPPLQVSSFEVTPYFKPPDDCGHDKPGYEPWPSAVPCVNVGTTPNGRTVWFADSESSNVRAWYTLIDDVQVTITTTDSPSGHDLPHEQIVAFVASLRLMSPAELRDLG